jgi:hypothetical protein
MTFLFPEMPLSTVPKGLALFPFPFSERPPYTAPTGLPPAQKNLLNQTKLVKLYEKNSGDFFALITLMYFIVMRYPNPGHYTDVGKGFQFFCDFLTEGFLAAPSEALVTSKDEKGRSVNFFGEAISAHGFPSKVVPQSLYVHDGSVRYSEEWAWVSVFVRFVAIDFFYDPSSFPMIKARVVSALERIRELMSGPRRLIFVKKSPLE